MLRSRVLPVVSAATALGIFVLDTITPAEIAVAVLYVVIVLLSARFLQKRGVVLASVGCIALTLSSFALSQHEASLYGAVSNRLISIAVIGVTAFLAARPQAREMVLREQAGLLDLTHDTIFVRNMNNVIIYWNRGAEELYGWGREEAVGKSSHQLMRTIFPLPLEEITAELLRADRWEGELVHTKKDGTQATVASRWAVQRDARAHPVAILETNNDVTERRRAEEALRESETRYRNIFETAGVSIWEEDFSRIKAATDELKAQGVRDFRAYLAANPEFVEQAISMVKVVDVNDATVSLFKARTKDELLGSLHAIFTPETLKVFAEELLAVAEDRSSFAAETTIRTLEGDELEVLFTITFPPQPVKLNRVLVTIMDITERKQAAEALRAARMELAHVNRVTVMGQLTASIAHEVNQPIAGVVTNAQAALRWLGTHPPDLNEIREALGRIVKDGWRASEVIDRVRALIKKAPSRKGQFDLDEAILDVIAMTRSEVLKHGVSLETKFVASLPPVEGDRVQLQQVILNLILNAVEAMSGIDERARELLINIGREASGDVLVTAQDTGPGLEPQAVDRLFEPFYTTKPGGLGMGLAICRSSIEAHGGRMWATASEPLGAAFLFTLPLELEKTIAAEPAGNSGTAPCAGIQ